MDVCFVELPAPRSVIVLLAEQAGNRHAIVPPTIKASNVLSRVRFMGKVRKGQIKSIQRRPPARSNQGC